MVCADAMNNLIGPWWEPPALLEAAIGAKRSVRSAEFFRTSDHQTIREAIVAARFAKMRPWNKDWAIRLNLEQFPDVEIRCGSDIRPIEVVEADRQGRRRYDEYRDAELNPGQLEDFDPGEDEQAALDAIWRVVRLKHAKRYRPKPNLLVYVNFWEGEPTSLFAQEVGDNFDDGFDSIWLGWGHGTYRLWPNPVRIKASA